MNEGLDLINDGFQLVHTHRTLLTGLQQTDHWLLPIKLFPGSILFDNHVGNLIDSFIAGEPSTTTQTLTSSADGFAFPTFTRIDNLIFQVATKRTFHVYWVENNETRKSGKGIDLKSL